MAIRLTYEIQNEMDVCTIRLQGILTPGNAMTLECCLDRVAQQIHESIVLNCEDLEAVDFKATKAFARFQVELRKQASMLHLYFLRPDLRTFLLQNGTIKEEECPGDISQVIQNNMIRKDAA